jgi:hypothetical protein
MAMPVKISDDLLERAKSEARDTHRSATAQIEHWATLDRAVEAMLAYGEVLALKRVGDRMPLPRNVPREALESRLAPLVTDPDRRDVSARIRAAGGPLYGADPDNPGEVLEVGEDGTRRSGTLRDRKFIPSKRRSGARGA